MLINLIDITFDIGVQSILFTGGSWKPKVTDTNQFIQVKLNRKEPIYGVIMQGNPLFDHFVTSYKVLYSENGHHFGEIKTKEGLPQVR